MARTYRSGMGANVAHFSKEQYDRNDKLGREWLSGFVTEILKGRVLDNDKDTLGTMKFNAYDALIETQGSSSKDFYRTEVEIKSQHLWKYIYDGIHFPWRKVEKVIPDNLDKLDHVLLCMFNGNGDELIIVNGEVIKLAFDTWPEFKGFGRLDSTPGFVVPDHGCYVVNKQADRGSPEHFVSIPYEKATHFSRKSGKWVKIHQRK